MRTYEAIIHVSRLNGKAEIAVLANVLHAAAPEFSQPAPGLMVFSSPHFVEVRMGAYRLIQALKLAGIKVTSYRFLDVIADSKVSDLFGLLPTG